MCIRATNQSVCLVTALLGYLATRPKRSGPMFIFQDGSTQSRERLISSLHQVMSDVGVSTAQCSGENSFRIGAATTAAKLGRWADGNRPCLRITFALHGGGWRASRAEGQSITYFQHVLLTPPFVSMMLCSGFDSRN